MAHPLETDVLVVGGGPGGAAAAYYLARQGLDVTVVDRSSFPREKVCGDGLTPRSVAALLRMGIDTDDPGFERVRGLRVYSRGATIELPWPELSSWPGYGLVMPRASVRPPADPARREGRRPGARANRGGLADVRRGVGHRRHAARRRRQGRRADRDQGPVHDRGRRRREPLRQARGGASRRFPAARHRRSPATTARPTTPVPGSNRGSTCGRATCCCPATAGCSRSPADRSTWAPVCSTPSRTSGRSPPNGCSTRSRRCCRASGRSPRRPPRAGCCRARCR